MDEKLPPPLIREAPPIDHLPDPGNHTSERVLERAHGLPDPEPPKGWREQLRERQMEKLVELCRQHGISDEEIARAITSAAEAPETR